MSPTISTGLAPLIGKNREKCTLSCWNSLPLHHQTTLSCWNSLPLYHQATLSCWNSLPLHHQQYCRAGTDFHYTTKLRYRARFVFHCTTKQRYRAGTLFHYTTNKKASKTTHRYRTFDRSTISQPEMMQLSKLSVLPGFCLHVPSSSTRLFTHLLSN